MNRLTNEYSILETIDKIQNDVTFLKEVALRLAVYEDTGLEPKEVIQNKSELNLAKKVIRDLRLTIEDLNKGWRSVLDELPKEDGEYLVTVKHKEFNQTRVQILDYYVKGWFLFDNSFDERWWEVIAWQPLPEPYKEVENEN